LSWLSSFSELGLSAPVVRALARSGIETPFEIQDLVIGDALSGRDVLAQSRTGSGKTVAFAAPMVDRIEPDESRPAAVVLVPTRELAVQVTGDFQAIAAARNLRVAPVYGGVPIDKQATRAAKAHIVVATPGRLWDLMNRKLLSVAHIRILVLDEADRMLDMGFQPQVDRIVGRLRGSRQTMFFSATLDGLVGRVARAYTNDPIRHEIHDARPVIREADHRFVAVDEHGKLEKLVEVLGEERDLALIFVRTKRGADRLQKRLATKGVRSLALHGDMTQGARKHALDRFNEGKVDVLVATDVAARGLDLDDITHVVNYDPPQDHKDYVHRVGRTARAGRAGAGVTFVAPAHSQEMSAIARRLQLNDEFQAEGLALAAPQRVFSSRGSRSMMRPRRRHKF
jgi:ATP-dependent RNA helicase RhlE